MNAGATPLHGEGSNSRPVGREESHIPLTKADSGYSGMAADTDPAVGVTSYLFAGPLAFGGVGYGLDRWFGTHVLVGVGILFGVALSIYIVWLRYGSGDRDRGPGALDAAPTRSDGTTGHEGTAAPRTTRPTTARTTNEEGQ